MYELEMLRHRTGRWTSRQEELYNIECEYPLNAYAKALFKIGSDFFEPTEDDIPTDEDNRRAGSNDESGEDGAELPLELVDAESDEAMEDWFMEVPNTLPSTFYMKLSYWGQFLF